MCSVIELGGCRPEPLGSYLKGLAVLRIVSRQQNPEAALAWQHGVARLRTRLSCEELVEFFLRKYRPLPAVSPWNGGSGFYADDEPEEMKWLLENRDERFEALRKAIQTVKGWPEFSRNQSVQNVLRIVRDEYSGKSGEKATKYMQYVQDVSDWLGNQKLAEKHNLESALVSQLRDYNVPEKIARTAGKLRSEANRLLRGGGVKEELIRRCRNELDDETLEWIDCAVFLPKGDEAQYPPLLGTGGNEGKLDYSAQFHWALMKLLGRSSREESAASEMMLRHALFAKTAEALVEASAGQYDPGRAGGFNQGFGFETKQPPINLWDYVLTLEGAVVWASGLMRRFRTDISPLLANPFIVELSPGGVTSYAENEDKNVRAELWAPLWSRFATYSEIAALFREGRITKGWRPARNGREVAEALASLGVDRGLSRFTRFLLAKRRGDSYVALPAGSYQVREEPVTRLLWEVDPFIDTLSGWVRGTQGKAPGSLRVLRQIVEDAVMDALAEPEARRFAGVLESLGQLEQWLGTQAKEKCEDIFSRPPGGLSGQWFEAANDGTPEFQVAASLANLGSRSELGILRTHWAPVAPPNGAQWTKPGPQLCWKGATLYHRMANTLRWRLQKALSRGQTEVQLCQQAEDVTPLAAIAQFLNEGLDLTRLENLLFGMSWIRRAKGSGGAFVRLSDVNEGGAELELPREYCLLKLLFTSHLPRLPGLEGEFLAPMISIISLLLAERVSEAVELAQRRLFAAGLAPVEFQFSKGPKGVILAAGLLLPAARIDRVAKLVLHEKE